MGASTLSDTMLVVAFFLIVITLSILGEKLEKKHSEHSDDIGAITVIFIIICVTYWLVAFWYQTRGV